tara:strand:+ start:851 stop:1054 length:204 start_codon:yes stop_codon:yes gene_type:complete
MVSLQWASNLGRAIPENWYPELLLMSEDKAKMFAQRFPYGRMKLPKIKKLKVEKKAPAKKKAAKKDE